MIWPQFLLVIPIDLLPCIIPSDKCLQPNRTKANMITKTTITYIAIDFLFIFALAFGFYIC